MSDRIYDFNKEKSVALKALLPFLIVVHHCACMGVPHLGPMMMAGVTICTWFFLISGYGLMASFMAKGDLYLQYFFRKRVTTQSFFKMQIALTMGIVHRDC